jgi:RHS repeat-associated protein
LVKDSFGGLTTYVYNKDDLLATEEFTGDGQILRVDRTYNTRNLVATEIRYNSLTTTSNGFIATTTYTYDNTSRLTNENSTNFSASTVFNATFGYDLADRITSQAAGMASATYRYDNANELTYDGSHTYTYDVAGNRTMTGYSTGTGNEVSTDGTWTYTYDAEGNIVSKSNASGNVWTYGYDDRNRLTSAKFQTSATAAATVTSGGTTDDTRFAYDGKNAWADMNSSNAIQLQHLYMPGGRLLAYVTSGGSVGWYLLDWEGSVRVALDNGRGTVVEAVFYDGFGNITAPMVTDRYTYTGSQWDKALGLYYNENRYYDPKLGRWTTQDPLGFTAGDTNLYRYVEMRRTRRGWIPSLPTEADEVNTFSTQYTGATPNSVFTKSENEHTRILWNSFPMLLRQQGYATPR